MSINLQRSILDAVSPPSFGGLDLLSRPPIHTLVELVHGCSESPVDRTVAITVFVFGCCQLAEGKLTYRTPSLILVNANSPEEDDPMATFADSLVAENRYHPPRSSNTGPSAFMEPEDARDQMLLALHQMQKCRGDSPYERQNRQQCEDYYFAAQQTGFGRGQSRPYASVWHKEFGLLSDRSCRVILHLRNQEDGTSFREDLIKRPSMLIHAEGVGPGLKNCPKHFGIAGSIPDELWDAKMAHALVDMPMPLLVLPHCTKTPLHLPHENQVGFFTDFLRTVFPGPVAEPDNFPQHSFATHYAAQLHKYVCHLPGDYEHSLQRLSRQLFPVCLRLAAYAGQKSDSVSPQQAEALAFDLYTQTLRGMTISAAGLAWHGLGFDAGCPRTEVARVLRYLRSKPPMTKVELLRNAHIASKETCAELLKHFVAEDLVRMDEEQIRATTFSEFVTALHQRKEFPFPENHWQASSKNSRGPGCCLG